jgi:hypothetical protein
LGEHLAMLARQTASVRYRKTETDYSSLTGEVRKGT